jgi:hypothetical protein
MQDMKVATAHSIKNCGNRRVVRPEEFTDEEMALIAKGGPADRTNPLG